MGIDNGYKVHKPSHNGIMEQQIDTESSRSEPCHFIMAALIICGDNFDSISM